MKKSSRRNLPHINPIDWSRFQTDQNYQDEIMEWEKGRAFLDRANQAEAAVVARIKTMGMKGGLDLKKLFNDLFKDPPPNLPNGAADIIFSPTVLDGIHVRLKDERFRFEVAKAFRAVVPSHRGPRVTYQDAGGRVWGSTSKRSRQSPLFSYVRFSFEYLHDHAPPDEVDPKVIAGYLSPKEKPHGQPFPVGNMIDFPGFDLIPKHLRRPGAGEVGAFLGISILDIAEQVAAYRKQRSKAARLPLGSFVELLVFAVVHNRRPQQGDISEAQSWCKKNRSLENRQRKRAIPGTQSPS